MNSKRKHTNTHSNIHTVLISVNGGCKITFTCVEHAHVSSTTTPTHPSNYRATTRHNKYNTNIHTHTVEIIHLLLLLTRLCVYGRACVCASAAADACVRVRACHSNKLSSPPLPRVRARACVCPFQLAYHTHKRVLIQRTRNSAAAAFFVERPTRGESGTHESARACKHHSQPAACVKTLAT